MGLWAGWRRWQVSQEQHAVAWTCRRIDYAGGGCGVVLAPACSLEAKMGCCFLSIACMSVVCTLPSCGERGMGVQDFAHPAGSPTALCDIPVRDPPPPPSSTCPPTVAPAGMYFDKGGAKVCPKGTFKGVMNRDSFCDPCPEGLTTLESGSLTYAARVGPAGLLCCCSFCSCQFDATAMCLLHALFPRFDVHRHSRLCHGLLAGTWGLPA